VNLPTNYPETLFHKFQILSNGPAAM